MPIGIYPRNLTPLADRFWAKVQKGDGCWTWTGARNRQGYGRINRGRVGDGWVRAHRLSWELAYGPVPANLWVLHRCDNPPCVRPDHLWLGTRLDNMRDCAAKGRINTVAARAAKAAKRAENREAMRAYLLALETA